MNSSILEWLKRKRLDVLPADSVRARLVRGTFWSLMSTVISQGLGLVASMVVARILGQIGFGELGIIRNTVGMLGVFAGFGLGTTATKYMAEFRLTAPERGGKILGLTILAAILSSLLISLSLLIFAPLLATSILNAPHLATELRLGCLLLFVEAINGTQIGGLSGFEAFKPIAQMTLWRGLINFPLTVGGCWLFGISGAISGMVLAAIVSCYINYLFLRRECQKANIKITYKKLDWGILWKFSLPALLAGAMVWPVEWIVSTMLVNQPDGYKQMGIFAAANQWRMALLFLPNIFRNINVPILSSLLSLQDIKRSKKVLISSVTGSAIITIPIAILLIFLSNSIMGLYGPEFAGQGKVLSIVALAIMLLAIQTPVGQIIVASGKMWLGMVMNLGWGLILLTATWLFLAQGWGAVGLALAYLIAYTFHSVWSFGFAFQFVRRAPKLLGSE